MNPSQIPANPFERIALSCSGGGYRAASYHLGTMAYLQHLTYAGKPLLEHVKMISTVSGGTITGIVYALGKARGKEFGEIYDFLIAQLRTLDLVKGGISMLNPGADWSSTTKQKNLINAFALLYDQYLTQGAVMSELDLKATHLEAVVFNATEFTNALDFRFRNKGTGYSGNFYNVVRAVDMAEAKLSDMMAASSCFPGGFEPILWPQDFVHTASPNLKALAQEKMTVGLMDGGIYDNQGIDSILKYKKKRGLANFDLIIVSDVASPKMAPFVPAPKAAKTGFYNWTIKDIRVRFEKIDERVSWGLCLLIAAGLLIPAANCFSGTFLNGFAFGLALSATILWIVKSLAIGHVRTTYNWVAGRVKGFLDTYYREKLAHLRIEELSLHRIEPLLVDRLNSVASLLTNVFLKVVRRLNYAILFEDPLYEYRRVGSLIRQLTEEDFTAALKRDRALKKQHPAVLEKSIFMGDYATDIGSKLETLTKEAANFGTTLWFTDQDQLSGMLDKLLTTGQATMCYNLIRYLEELIFTPDNGFSLLPQEIQKAIQATYEQCKADWYVFKGAAG